jgi:hypothetical protein
MVQQNIPNATMIRTKKTRVPCKEVWNADRHTPIVDYEVGAFVQSETTIWLKVKTLDTDGAWGHRQGLMLVAKAM